MPRSTAVRTLAPGPYAIDDQGFRRMEKQRSENVLPAVSPHESKSESPRFETALAALRQVAGLSEWTHHTSLAHMMNSAVSSALTEQVAELRREVESLRDVLRWRSYLDRIEDRGASPVQARVIRQLWARLQDEIGWEPPLPMAVNGQGGIRVAWSRLDWYLGVEIMPLGEVEWFYRNRKTGDVDGTKDEAEAILPNRFFELLSQHAAS